jgi:hypothetical protein
MGGFPAPALTKPKDRGRPASENLHHTGYSVTQLLNFKADIAETVARPSAAPV